MNKKVIVCLCALFVIIIAMGVVVGMKIRTDKKEQVRIETQKKEEAQKAKAEAEKVEIEKAEAQKEAEVQKATETQKTAEKNKAEEEKNKIEAEQAQLEKEKAVALEVEAEEAKKQKGTTCSNGHKIAIDAGHQRHGNSEKEPIGPGAGESKAKVASGTSGCVSGLDEYELNLQVSLKLRDELTARGYEVVMIRETQDVDISNAERAKIANDSGAEIFLRIHANGDDNSSVRGALTMAPSSGNPYVANISSQCQKLSQDVIDAYCQSTGMKNRGVLTTDTMSGINWCTIPVTIVEMGFMSNPEDDANMAEKEYQGLIVKGIANGVDQYFA